MQGGESRERSNYKERRALRARKGVDQGGERGTGAKGGGFTVTERARGVERLRRAGESRAYSGISR